MDRTTTITDQNITRLEHDAGQPAPLADVASLTGALSANTVGESRPIERASSTNSLPESISTSWAKIAQANMSVRMYGDLVRIAKMQDGWHGVGSRSLRPASLNSFLQFWMMIRDEAAEPEIALSPDGSIHAEWFKSFKQRLDVRFAEQIYFGVFSNRSILEGAQQIAAVAQILKSHPGKPLMWTAR